ncbi:MAG: TrkA family potassium uptake protein [Lentisphaeria bacterium]|nr:TrkA family potassium uptake protein [Lentisphaeria bacterium]MBO5765786.1 TrkA family potassium uptake protein [Lentisphaeria bacterium]MBO5990356.1 TrkA family potassium uptake protein [Lentisphaeria bacterium]MBO7152642.1 TrkA family potassium uptake protein [Lentisphaeria bacterium]
MAKKSYAVCGLGAFGSRLAVALADADHYVMACDVNPARVNAVRDKVLHAVIVDVSDKDAVKELDISRFDAVILSMNSFFEKQILALTLLKDQGAKRVIAKASSDIQEKILYRLGADEVIRPEQDVAMRLSKRLEFENISDMYEFKDHSIAEVVVPASLDGKSLKELDLRGQHSINVLLINKPAQQKEQTTGPLTVLERGDKLTVFGKSDEIIKLFREK